MPNIAIPPKVFDTVFAKGKSRNTLYKVKIENEVAVLKRFVCENCPENLDVNTASDPLIRCGSFIQEILVSVLVSQFYEKEISPNFPRVLAIGKQKKTNTTSNFWNYVLGTEIQMQVLHLLLSLLPSQKSRTF